MQELSLNILDIAQNSVSAGATLVEIEIRIDIDSDRMDILVRDNGCGMTESQKKQVTDPFYTTRTTRKVGLGVPFFGMAAQLAGGDMKIESQPGIGTEIKAWFVLSHIDRMPLGDMGATMASLIQLNPEIDFVYRYRNDGEGFTADTREFRQALDGVSLSEPEVAQFIRQYVNENTAEADGLSSGNMEG